MIVLDITIYAQNSYDSFVKYYYINRDYNSKKSRYLFFHNLRLFQKY